MAGAKVGAHRDGPRRAHHVNWIFYPPRIIFMTLYRSFLVCAILTLFACLAPFTASAWQLQTAPIVTSWAQLVDTNNPLPEYPRPQMVRSNWLNLNGIWQFQAGATNDPVPTNQTLAGDILVPYPMESALSGVAEYHLFSWYRRTFTVPPA